MSFAKRPIIVANVSGATGDGPLALYRVVREGPVDVVTADYLAEVNVGMWPVDGSLHQSRCINTKLSPVSSLASLGEAA